MVKYCSINGCHQTSVKGTSFFRIPSAMTSGHPFKQKLSSLRRQRWLDAIKITDLTEVMEENIIICQDHFISSKPADLLDQDNPDWVPNLKLGYNTNQNPTNFRNEYIVDFDEYEEEVLEKKAQLAATKVIQTDAITQTDLSMHDISSLVKSHEDFVRDICTLKSNLITKELNEDTFRDDDAKTRYYTGLNSFKNLMTVFELVSPCLKDQRNSLTKFQQYLLTLMRLRLNLDLQDLSYRFSIGKSTAMRMFYKVLDAMYTKLKGFIVWPDRDSGEKTTLVIDSLEIDIEKTSKPGSAASHTKIGFSNKHNNVVKYLIGVCPEGSLCFISEAHLGHTLDEIVDEEFADGDLEKSIPYDFILPGKNSHESYCFKMEPPPSKKRKRQNSQNELAVEGTKELVSVRKHITQIKYILKQRYRILEGKVSIVVAAHTSGDDIPCLDKIITVTSALVNMCPIHGDD